MSRYLKGTFYHGLHLTKSTSLCLTICSDVDWYGDKDDHTFVSTYIVYFGNNPISLCFCKQQSVVYSSIEAYYQTVATIALELALVKSFLHELQVLLSTSLTIFYASLTFHSKMKHISIDYHFVHDQVSKG